MAALLTLCRLRWVNWVRRRVAVKWPHVVIGAMPRYFAFPLGVPKWSIELWVPKVGQC
jgi:hypothetical protein